MRKPGNTPRIVGKHMKITGHKTESVYRRYAIVSDADLQEATRRLVGTFPGTIAAPPLDSREVTPQNSGPRAVSSDGRAPAF